MIVGYVSSKTHHASTVVPYAMRYASYSANVSLSALLLPATDTILSRSALYSSESAPCVSRSSRSFCTRSPDRTVDQKARERLRRPALPHQVSRTPRPTHLSRRCPPQTLEENRSTVSPTLILSPHASVTGTSGATAKSFTSEPFVESVSV